MTINEAHQQLLFQLYHIYDDREAAAITNLVMENITEWTKIDRVLNKNLPLSLPKIDLLKKYTEELLQHKPLQYVLHEAWFAGMKFYVDEHVLIPRPETEELVDWLVSQVMSKNISEDAQPLTGTKETNQPTQSETSHSPLRILDIGTGSGCIPIALKKRLPFAELYSCDISEAALNVARLNAKNNQQDIHFIQLDFLNQSDRESLPKVDIIISNPPYIPIKDINTMMPNVTAHEPHLALFVENENPLIFYKAIVDFAKEKLVAGGMLFVETHECQASHVKELFPDNYFTDIEIKTDMQGKQRMIKATMLP
ncbi:MAG: peptide chain release factor N(5)-glutamine methyltransferase [Bacteroidetes bacterium]|nr:peptide chain release factor N(5)-glutamine methyltransferase [Bacteroidota bacterium]